MISVNKNIKNLNLIFNIAGKKNGISITTVKLFFLNIFFSINNWQNF